MYIGLYVKYRYLSDV